MTTLYKFLRTGMRSVHGNCTWKIGRWKHENAISLCNYGFHASVRAIDALSYVSGEVLAVVEVKGKHLSHEDKQVWTDMRVIKAYHWTKADSVALSIFAAEQVIEIYEKQYPSDDRPRQAIEAAKDYFKNPSNDAADAAVRAADAAHDAADAAAYAARAVRAAARAAARAADAAYAAYTADAYAAADAAAYAARAAADAADAARTDDAAGADDAGAADAAYAAYTAADAAYAAAYAARAAKVEILDKINAWIIDRIPTLEEVKG